MGVSRLSGASAATTTVKVVSRAVAYASGKLNTVTETLSDGTINVRTFTYDATSGYLTKVVDTNPASTQTMTYDASGNLTNVAVS